eukprot:4473347-Prymnesium_polylepis.1
MVRAFGKLEPATIARHAHAILQLLEDRREHVRRAAVRVLGKIDGPALAGLAPQLLVRLGHADKDVPPSRLPGAKPAPNLRPDRTVLDVFDTAGKEAWPHRSPSISLSTGGPPRSTRALAAPPLPSHGLPRAPPTALQLQHSTRHVKQLQGREAL